MYVNFIYMNIFSLCYISYKGQGFDYNIACPKMAITFLGEVLKIRVSRNTVNFGGLTKIDS